MTNKEILQGVYNILNQEFDKVNTNVEILEDSSKGLILRLNVGNIEIPTIILTYIENYCFIQEFGGTETFEYRNIDQILDHIKYTIAENIIDPYGEYEDIYDIDTDFVEYKVNCDEDNEEEEEEVKEFATKIGESNITIRYVLNINNDLLCSIMIDGVSIGTLIHTTEYYLWNLDLRNEIVFKVGAYMVNNNLKLS